MAIFLPHIMVIAAVVLASVAGCMLLSLPSALANAAPPDHRGRRTLKLMPQREIIHYGRDPKTVRRINRQPAVRASGKAVSWWKDIDYGQRGLCGKEKCFFLSLVDPTRGYLVGRGDFDRTARAYALAVELASEYGARHFSTAPPFEDKMPEYFRRHLLGEYKSFYKDAASLVIQPMLTALEGSVVVRCYDPRVSIGRIDYMLGYMHPEAQRALVEELERTVLIVAQRPELRTDFQLMIDRQGRAYHLDLDRVAKGEASRKDIRHFAGCLESAIDHVRKKIAVTESDS